MQQQHSGHHAKASHILRAIDIPFAAHPTPQLSFPHLSDEAPFWCLWLYLQHTLKTVEDVPECERVVVLHHALTKQHTYRVAAHNARLQYEKAWDTVVRVGMWVGGAVGDSRRNLLHASKQDDFTT